MKVDDSQRLGFFDVSSKRYRWVLARHAGRALLGVLSLPCWITARAVFGMDDRMYHIKMGDALIAIGAYSWGSRHFTKVLEHEESAWAHMQAGYALLRLKRYNQGLSHYRKGYLLWPNPVLAAHLARTELHFGNLKEARELAEAARRERGHLDPFSLDLLDGVQRDLDAREAGDKP